MIDAALAISTGLLLGLLFFGGLWWTVHQLGDFRRPALILFGSLVLRTVVVLGGFYWVAGGEWSQLLFCVLGFLAGRLAVTWSTRLPSPSRSQETRRAP